MGQQQGDFAAWTAIVNEIFQAHSPADQDLTAEVTSLAGQPSLVLYNSLCKSADVKPNSRLHALFRDFPDPDNVRALVLKENYLGKKAYAPFLAMLALCRNCTELDLQGCNLETPEVVVLCKVLKRHPSVGQVNLSRNPFASIAGQAVLETVEYNDLIEVMGVEEVTIDRFLRQKIEDCCARNKVTQDKARARRAELQEQERQHRQQQILMEAQKEARRKMQHEVEIVRKRREAQHTAQLA